jgi:hypothetical protein
VGLSHALAKAAPHHNENRKKCGKWKKVRDREFFAEQLNNRFLAFITLPNRYVTLFASNGTRRSIPILPRTGGAVRGMQRSWN